jgi:hypothetical protein
VSFYQWEAHPFYFRNSSPAKKFFTPTPFSAKIIMPFVAALPRRRTLLLHSFDAHGKYRFFPSRFGRQSSAACSNGLDGSAERGVRGSP